MKIKFNTDSTFNEGIKRLSPVLGFEIDDNGISLDAVQGEKIGASLKDGKGTIYYSSTHHFFRELGVFLEHAKKEKEFEIFEDTFFKTTGVMLDVSRGAVPTVKSIYKTIDYLAIMGYNMVMLYAEDMIQLEDRPYFGYMRGRYTKEDLRAVDDYAFDYGIEVIPCIECYGHMEKYLIWPEAYEITDTAEVLLAREEKTFQFLESIISLTSSIFRSKRIHIGMDEAWNMGRGKFMDKHGYVAPIDIFNEFMEELIKITNKYNLVPMMWSDMYFRTNAKDGSGYYYEDTVIPESTKKIIPKEVQLVFWHYGEAFKCDDFMLKKHKELDRDVIFCGGSWSWIGHFPEHNYTLETTKFSLEACRNNDVREMISSIWLNDYAECNIFATLYDLSLMAELCYNKDITKEEMDSRFAACTGGNPLGFYTMSQYHNKFDENEKYENYNHRFLGKPLFWQDIMLGLFDTHILNRPLSDHYKKCAEIERNIPADKWDYLYKFATSVFDFLALKTEFVEKAIPAYKNGDRETLTYISNTLLPALCDKSREVHNAHKKMWFENYKAFGWNALDNRYGGMTARCVNAKERLDDYLSGKIDTIEEFDETRLYRSLSGFLRYPKIWGV